MPSRSRHREWKNNKDDQGRWKPWFRRVTWYMSGSKETSCDIRLRFEDEHGQWNETYDDYDVAQKRYDAFREGKLTWYKRKDDFDEQI